MGSEILRTTEHVFSSNVDGMEWLIVLSEYRPSPVGGVEPEEYLSRNGGYGGTWTCDPSIMSAPDQK